MNQLNIIKQKIEELYDLNLEKKTRKREYVEARSLFCKICRDTLNVTFQQIGNVINKNHATAVYYKKTIENLMTYDKDIVNNYNEILQKLHLEEENFDHLDKDELKTLIKSLKKENKLLKLQLQK
tara:strand:+ start:5494 stop:5868 length:375 start_codon:yes stop_codon:yes gene_type:complete